jgi:hypothetical protein
MGRVCEIIRVSKQHVTLKVDNKQSDMSKCKEGGFYQKIIEKGDGAKSIRSGMRWLG